MNGDIMTISRLRMGTDGDGVTTLVGMWGCPLSCKYCINEHCHTDDITRGDYTPEELVETLSVDDIYFRMSGGGITFGGGEPLMQSDFIHEVCQLVKPGWTVRVETSLNVPENCMNPLIDDIDEWIIDVKSIDNDLYTRYTGVSNEKMISNLLLLKNKVDISKLRIRVPVIPGYTEGISSTSEWVRTNIGVEPDEFKYFACINGIGRERHFR